MKQTLYSYTYEQQTTVARPDHEPHEKKRLAGALEGLSSAAATTTTGMRETGRESLTFSGMGDAAFNGFPPLEAVHFDREGGVDNDGVGC